MNTVDVLVTKVLNVEDVVMSKVTVETNCYNKIGKKEFIVPQDEVQSFIDKVKHGKIIIQE